MFCWKNTRQLRSRKIVRSNCSCSCPLCSSQENSLVRRAFFQREMCAEARTSRSWRFRARTTWIYSLWNVISSSLNSRVCLSELVSVPVSGLIGSGARRRHYTAAPPGTTVLSYLYKSSWSSILLRPWQFSVSVMCVSVCVNLRVYACVSVYSRLNKGFIATLDGRRHECFVKVKCDSLALVLFSVAVATSRYWPCKEISHRRNKIAVCAGDSEVYPSWIVLRGLTEENYGDE